MPQQLRRNERTALENQFASRVLIYRRPLRWRSHYENAKAAKYHFFPLADPNHDNVKPRIIFPRKPTPQEHVLGACRPRMSPQEEHARHFLPRVELVRIIVLMTDRSRWWKREKERESRDGPEKEDEAVLNFCRRAYRAQSRDDRGPSGAKGTKRRANQARRRMHTMQPAGRSVGEQASRSDRA